MFSDKYNAKIKLIIAFMGMAFFPVGFMVHILNLTGKDMWQSVWMPLLIMVVGLVPAAFFLAEFILHPLRNTEFQLVRQKKYLEKVNLELDSFVYTASHDLRAPLRAISSFASFLEEDYREKIDDSGHKYIKQIRKSANRLDMLIDDLLTLSRFSRITNPYENVLINHLIESVIERLEFDIHEYKVTIKIQEDMPMILCDRIKVAEVFLNLVNNAIKFSSKYISEDPQINIGYKDTGGYHEFYVQDNGIGIDPKYQKQIFDIFRRLHKAGEYEGTGAGLSIVKRIVNDHGGKVYVESKVGSGAKFYFTIPKEITEHKKIGEMLVDDGVISQKKLEEVLTRQEG